MSDHISRAKLFDKLATVNGEDANDMKAKIYAVIQEMETEPDLSGDWVELHDHISKNMEQLRLQVRESMARISESIREAMQGREPQMMVFDCPMQEENADYFKWLYEDEPSNSEKPNNYCDDCLYTDTCDSKEFFYACTSKATISKMEQVDKDINVRSKDEPHCYTCKYERRGCADEPCVDCRGRSKYEPKDEPQDEYAKEYEELGLRKLKELRKDEPQTNADQHVQHVGSVEPMQTEREGE